MIKRTIIIKKEGKDSCFLLFIFSSINGFVLFNRSINFVNTWDLLGVGFHYVTPAFRGGRHSIILLKFHNVGQDFKIFSFAVEYGMGSS